MVSCGFSLQNIADTPGDSKSPFFIVWCHERCCKAENASKSESMQEEVEKLGGRLIRCRKAMMFDRWMKRAEQSTYILITDWREAQPCIQYISEEEGSNRPSLTFVLCDTTRQLGRATKWAKQLPSSAGAVQVCVRSNISESYLEGFVRKHFGQTEGEESDLLSTQPVPHETKISVSIDDGEGSLFEHRSEVESENFASGKGRAGEYLTSFVIESSAPSTTEQLTTARNDIKPMDKHDRHRSSHSNASTASIGCHSDSENTSTSGMDNDCDPTFDLEPMPVVSKLVPRFGWQHPMIPPLTTPEPAFVADVQMRWRL